MHELSFINNVIEMVSAHPAAGRGGAVRTVRLRVGEGAGVEPGSLEFCFGCVRAGTPLESASLEIERVPFTVACHGCGAGGSADPAMTLCPVCGSRDVSVVAGCELDVISFELENSEEEVS